MKVLVLMGGTSAEREVSLRSGRAVYHALKQAGYEAIELDFTGNNLGEISKINPDVVFIALHGKQGEDGTVQGHLELLGIPYTGSGVATSAVCMDKILTKKLLDYDGIPTADFMIVSRSQYELDPTNIECEIAQQLGIPVVIKPATQGSSIGTVIVRNTADIREAFQQAFVYDHDVLVEEFIDGTEITVAIIGNENAQVLPIIEITSENEFYDYESKYTQGMCHHIIPARIAEEIAAQANLIAQKAYQAMGCRGFARVDIMIDQQGNPYVLEINTIPGMTEMSLVPDAARAAGIEFVQLVDKIIKLALEVQS
ncbi:D-alanine--D-alanine ligase [Syntrophomonas erecta]